MAIQGRAEGAPTVLCPETPTLTKPVKPDKKGLQSLGVPIIESGLRSKPWNLIRAESPRSGRPANLRREAMSRIGNHHRLAPHQTPSGFSLALPCDFPGKEPCKP